MDYSNKKVKITLGTFDLIKGIAIITIIMGHALAKYKMRNVQMSFPLNILGSLIANGTMPMFFILAGYSYKARPVGKMMKKSFKDLMKPYFIVMVLIVVLYPACHFILDGWSASIQTAIQYVGTFLLGLPVRGKTLFDLQLLEAPVVWFLLAMFIATNLMNCILKINNSYLKNLLVVGITIIGYILAKLEFVYFCIPQGMVGLGFCYAGYLAKKYNFFEKGNKFIWLAIVAITLIQVIYGNFNLASSLYTLGYFSYIGAVTSGIIMMYIGLLIQNVSFPLSSIIRKTGMYSYWIMCIHGVELAVLPWHNLARLLKGLFNEGIAFTTELILKVILISLCCIAIKKFTKLKYKRRLASHAK